MMRLNSPIFKYKSDPFLWKYNNINYLKKKEYNNIEQMKKNSIFKKTNTDETIIDIDAFGNPNNNNESKYIYYPSPKKTLSDINDETVNKKIVKEIIEEPINVIKEQPVVKKVEKNISEKVEKVEKVEKKCEQTVEMTKHKRSESLNATEIVQEESKRNPYTEDDLLFNLKIISELNTADKLSCSSKLFKIDDPSYTQGIYRWWYGEDRAKTLERLNQIIDSTFEYMDRTFTQRVRSPGSCDTQERVLYETNSQIMQKFYITLIDTIKGLDKLRSTYVIDKSMTTGLGLLIEKIRRRTDKINGILNITP